ncbi:MAG: secondary thiamine-phosphate synthase enzyme YjbQ [Sedimentisphaerales bacterium]|nr:secondary thiamine-phosphate synthase enzyme YjbQ [Sedimentisphaerales bacterium]
MRTISIETHHRNEFLDITEDVVKTVNQSNLQNGIVVVYVPHTTAGVTINENADPSVVHDILLTLEELVPYKRAGYQHSEGNSDSHVKASLIGSSVMVPVEAGRLSLGTWQGIYFAEFDGPRQRRCIIQVLPA